MDLLLALLQVATLPGHCAPDHWISKRGPAAKFELLHHVVRTLGDRHRIVEAQRTEGRLPDQTDTNRTANHIAVVERQSRTSSNRLVGGNAACHVDFAGLREGRRSLVSP